MRTSVKGVDRALYTEHYHNGDIEGAIEDVKSVKSEDLEITKEGGETVISVSWSTKVPLVGNAAACLDFSVTTAK